MLRLFPNKINGDDIRVNSLALFFCRLRALQIRSVQWIVLIRIVLFVADFRPIGPLSSIVCYTRNKEKTNHFGLDINQLLLYHCSWVCTNNRIPTRLILDCSLFIECSKGMVVNWYNCNSKNRVWQGQACPLSSN